MAKSTWDESIILDDKHLRDFTGNDVDFRQQILSVFLENAPGYLEILCRPGNDNWRSDAHKLKGAARSIGAWRLACEAERAEHLGYPSENDPRRKRIVKELLARLEQTIAHIQSMDNDA